MQRFHGTVVRTGDSDHVVKDTRRRGEIEGQGAAVDRQTAHRKNPACADQPGGNSPWLDGAARGERDTSRDRTCTSQSGTVVDRDRTRASGRTTEHRVGGLEPAIVDRGAAQIGVGILQAEVVRPSFHQREVVFNDAGIAGVCRADIARCQSHCVISAVGDETCGVRQCRSGGVEMADGLVVAIKIQHTFAPCRHIARGTADATKCAGGTGSKDALEHRGAAGEGAARARDRHNVKTLLGERASAGDVALQFQDHAMILLVYPSEEIGARLLLATTAIETIDAVGKILTDGDPASDAKGHIAAHGAEHPGNIVVVGDCITLGEVAFDAAARSEVDRCGRGIGLVGVNLQSAAIDADRLAVAGTVHAPALDAASFIRDAAVGRDVVGHADVEDAILAHSQRAGAKGAVVQHADGTLLDEGIAGEGGVVTAHKQVARAPLDQVSSTGQASGDDARVGAVGGIAAPVHVDRAAAVEGDDTRVQVAAQRASIEVEAQAGGHIVLHSGGGASVGYIDGTDGLRGIGNAGEPVDNGIVHHIDGAHGVGCVKRAVIGGAQIQRGALAVEGDGSRAGRTEGVQCERAFIDHPVVGYRRGLGGIVLILADRQRARAELGDLAGLHDVGIHRQHSGSGGVDQAFTSGAGGAELQVGADGNGSAGGEDAAHVVARALLGKGQGIYAARATGNVEGRGADAQGKQRGVIGECGSRCDVHRAGPNNRVRVEICRCGDHAGCRKEAKGAANGNATTGQEQIVRAGDVITGQHGGAGYVGGSAGGDGQTGTGISRSDTKLGCTSRGEHHGAGPATRDRGTGSLRQVDLTRGTCG